MAMLNNQMVIINYCSYSNGQLEDVRRFRRYIHIYTPCLDTHTFHVFLLRDVPLEFFRHRRLQGTAAEDVRIDNQHRGGSDGYLLRGDLTVMAQLTALLYGYYMVNIRLILVFMVF